MKAIEKFPNTKSKNRTRLENKKEKKPQINRSRRNQHLNIGIGRASERWPRFVPHYWNGKSYWDFLPRGANTATVIRERKVGVIRESRIGRIHDDWISVLYACLCLSRTDWKIWKCFDWITTPSNSENFLFFFHCTALYGMQVPAKTKEIPSSNPCKRRNTGIGSEIVLYTNPWDASS